MNLINDNPADQDVRQIIGEDWQRRRIPANNVGADAAVVIKRSVLNEIHAHGRTSSDIEICGVLIGNVYRDGKRAFVHVEAVIRGNHAASKSAQVTFTADTWNHIQNTLDNEHPDKRILGWYHTHPGYGIFLSDMDVFIHKNFFSLPWHSAFVYDPQANEEGLFSWHGGKLASEQFGIQEDVARDENPAELAKPRDAAPAAQPGTFNELTERIQTLEQRQRWLLAGLAVCGLLAVAWPMVIGLLVPTLKHDVAPDPISVPALRSLPPGSSSTAFVPQDHAS